MSFLRPIRDTWTTSFSVGLERVRRGGVRRLLLAWVVQATALLLVGWLVPGIEVEDLRAALIGAIVIALLNALVRPVLVILTLPLSVATIGLTSLAINAIMLVVAAPLVPGLEIGSFASAIVAAIVLTLITTIVSVALSSDQDDTFYAELSRRLTYSESARAAGGRGLLIVQIDGLAAPTLRSAIRVGLTPWMASRVRSGRYHLLDWECVPPSQTSASQAGILHGDNTDIPAFRWYEKESGRLLVSNHPADATEIERRISNGRGLLAAGGTSVGNLFSGDARRTLFVMSRMSPNRATDVDAFSLYFMDPAAFMRTAILSVGEAFKEILEARRQRAMDIQPRVHRGATFAFMRAATNVVMRDLNVTFVLDSMRRGAPVIYVDFVDYDEVAHHAGPERLESLRSLAGVDRVLGSLERAAADAPRDYEIVVVSDHGQSQGATFRDRYGATLGDVIEGLMGGRAATFATTEAGEGWGPVNALLTEVRQRPGMTGRVASSALGGRTVDGFVELGSDRARETERDRDKDEAPQVVVCASGNLANAYFLDLPGRATLEAIEERHPGLLPGLSAHPGIGFVLVRSATLGAVALGRSGAHYLADGHVEGDDPLAPFGSRAADHLRRLDGFSNVGDLLVNSMYDAELEEVAAFEELVGSHGGFGGPQTKPFLLAPDGLQIDDEPLVGAPAVHRQLVRWAEQLGVGPSSGGGDSPLLTDGPPKSPRGIGVVALFLGLSGLPWVALGLIGLLGELMAGTIEPLVPILLALGLGVLVTAVGLWRRRRWAWMTTLILQGISVLMILLGLGTLGLEAFAAFGFLPTVAGLLGFYYLTRPHVAAAFGHRRPS